MDELKVADIAWGKVVGYPPWPCVILKCINGDPKASKNPRKKYFWVYFFGSNNYAWIPKIRLTPFEKYKHKKAHAKRPFFTEAVQEAEEHLGRMKSNPNHKVTIQEQFKSRQNKVKVKRIRKEHKEAEEHLGRMKSNSNHKVTIQEQFKSRQNKVKVKRNVRREHKKDTKQKQQDIKLKKLTIDLRNLRSRKVSPLPSRIQCSNGILDTKEIGTSRLIFGVLGTGIIGSGVVKNLIRSGHIVNIWNRTGSKCDKILAEFDKSIKIRARVFVTPDALLQSSNIILVCVSNQEVAKMIFQDSFGINNPSNTRLQHKGVVQITTTGPEASKDIKAIVEKQGGKYLEAQVQGSRAEAEEGNLLILTAGDESLYLECQPCFKAISKSVVFLGEVGYASKLNLILQLIKGVNLAALAEGLSLAERCGVPHKEFLDIFNCCQLDSPYLKGKANIILHKNFNYVEQALRHLQKDLKLGLDLSNNAKQSMCLANTANEIFKHCKKLGYGGHDASVIYMRNRH